MPTLTETHITSEPNLVAQTGEEKKRRRVRLLSQKVLSVILTTTLGGVLGAWLQQRSWERQKQIEWGYQKQLWLLEGARQASQKEREKALAELNEASQFRQRLSELMDRRLHCMRAVINDFKSADTPPDRAKRNRDRYDRVFTDWNGRLNDNIVLSAQYFGPKMRERLENKIISEFANLHRLMQRGQEDAGSLEVKLGQLQRGIYLYNNEMLERIQEMSARLAKQE